ncbi:hypothetical protein [Streptomyces sp. NPDC048639]|uniref:hypothetical protein n=1 Tax=Streptomyces sp. NPDC048639 TaxID=3365581 RepID=UPI00371E49C7
MSVSAEESDWPEGSKVEIIESAHRPLRPAGADVTLYGEPSGETSRELRKVKFGEDIRIPAPFDVTIDTSVFPIG